VRADAAAHHERRDAALGELAEEGRPDLRLGEEERLERELPEQPADRAARVERQKEAEVRLRHLACEREAGAGERRDDVEAFREALAQAAQQRPHRDELAHGRGVEPDSPSPGSERPLLGAEPAETVAGAAPARGRERQRARHAGRPAAALMTPRYAATTTGSIMAPRPPPPAPLPRRPPGRARPRGRDARRLLLGQDDGRAHHVRDARERPRDLHPVPAPQAAHRVRRGPDRDQRETGRARELDGAFLGDVARPARTVGRDREVLAARPRGDQAAEAAEPTAGLGAAHRPDAEPPDRLRRDLGVAASEHHAHGPGPALAHDEDREQRDRACRTRRGCSPARRRAKRPSWSTSWTRSVR
jgi:hypothetical protein